MTEPIQPKPQSRGLPEHAVAAAHQDPDPANPIAAELTRLTDGYTSNFRASSARSAILAAKD
jgi:hypothetical protein